MKQIFYTFLVLIAVAFTVNDVAAQPRYPASYGNAGIETFFYYPQSNLYYSFRTRQYIYPWRGGWQIANRLPRHIRLGRQDRITVEHRGFDVWNDNANHQYTYARRYQLQPAIVYTPDQRPGRY